MYDTWKLELPANLIGLSLSKRKKWVAKYNSKWKKEYLCIEEVIVGAEVVGIDARFVGKVKILLVLMESSNNREIKENSSQHSLAEWATSINKLGLMSLAACHLKIQLNTEKRL